MKAVLDTSAVLGMAHQSFEGYCVPPGVVKEAGKEVEYALNAGLRVLYPDTNSLRAVRKAAASTGDADILSETDIEVLALAHSLGIPVMSDDYAIQNTAEHMGISYEPVSQKPIKEYISWVYKCTGCGKLLQEHMSECPVCGSHVKRVPRRKVSLRKPPQPQP